jgi:hypothetical protein
MHNAARTRGGVVVFNKGLAGSPTGWSSKPQPWIGSSPVESTIK